MPFVEILNNNLAVLLWEEKNNRCLLTQFLYFDAIALSKLLAASTYLLLCSAKTSNRLDQACHRCLVISRTWTDLLIDCGKYFDDAIFSAFSDIFGRLENFTTFSIHSISVLNAKYHCHKQTHCGVTSRDRSFPLRIWCNRICVESHRKRVVLS